MKKLSILSILITFLSACNSGGSSSSNDNGGNNDNTATLGPQWTNQIGSASDVSGTDIISLEPVSNIIYKLDKGRTNLCTISATANSTALWNCSSVSTMSNFPVGYTIYSSNLIPDGNGNMYAFAYNYTQYVLLKYDGSSWSSTNLNNAPVGINFATIFYYNGYVYGTTNVAATGSNKQYNLIAFNTTTGNYDSTNSINGVYTGLNIPSPNSATIANNTFYVTNLSSVTATSLTNTNNVTTYSGSSLPSAIGVTNSNVYICAPLQVSGKAGTGINTTSLSNSGIWTNAGYTSYITASGYNVYQGCYSMYATPNKVFVIGYVNSGGNSAAVFTK